MFEYDVVEIPLSDTKIAAQIANEKDLAGWKPIFVWRALSSSNQPVVAMMLMRPRQLDGRE